MKRWQTLVASLLVIVVAGAAFAYTRIRALEVEQLSEDLFVLRGMGGNVAVLKTDTGTVIVDSMTLPIQGERIRELARELTGSEVLLIINTHYHLDHTHGNPAFAPGTAVMSTERTLQHLKALDADFWSGEAARLLPGETFTDQVSLNIGGKRMELIHPGRGHTDGDLVVVFSDERVVHTGDLLFNGHYPNIDLEAGGTISGWPATLDRVLELDFDRVIPGHGPTTDAAGIRQFQRFLRQLAEIGRTAAESGAELESVRDSDALTEDAGYEAIRFFGVSLGLDRSFVLQRAWEEATGNFTLAEHLR